MNKAIYRLVWNSRLGAPQVVSEVAKSKTCGGSVSVSGPGARTSRARGKAAIWPLALLSLGMASSVFAAQVYVNTGADLGTGSLRDLLSTRGLAIIDPGVSAITLASPLPAFNGPTRLIASAPLTITGGSLVGSNSSLLLTGASSIGGALTTTIAGQFTGVSGSGTFTLDGNPGTAGAGGTAFATNGSTGSSGSAGQYSSPSNGSAAISGSFFAITIANQAVVTGGARGLQFSAGCWR